MEEIDEMLLRMYSKNIEYNKLKIKSGMRTGLITAFSMITIILISGMDVSNKIIIMVFGLSLCLYGFGLPILQLRKHNKMWENKTLEINNDLNR